MAFSFQKTGADYTVVAEPLVGRTLARQGDAVIAESEKALVLHETRLPSAVYFPLSDVKVLITRNDTTRTFCPFKGTANWYDLQIEGRTIANAAWSYDNALPEASAIRGHISFAPEATGTIMVDGQELTQPSHGHVSGPLVDWLLRQSAICPTPEALTAALGERLNKDGVAVSRLSVFIWSLHPLIAGRNYVWLRQRGEVATFTASYDILETPGFANSPMRHAAHGLGGVRQRLGEGPMEFDFPVLDDLRKKGATDYVAMPMTSEQGPSNLLTLACDHPDGFTTANLGLVSECSLILGRLYEGFALRENSRTLLNTYLGARTGARVLSGEIRRGDGDEIEAAIMYCDLRNSTALEGQFSRADYLTLLNGFFETVTDLIDEHGGEVLKFIGDAVLAVFPTEKESKKACHNACEAAIRIVERLRGSQDNGDIALDCAIGIAYGDVTYGNVGSSSRLDFTVIGAAANVAARLAEHAKGEDSGIVVTDKVSKHMSDLARKLGKLTLRGVEAPVVAWTLLPQTQHSV
jgi:adenylate cyclase